MKIYDRNLSGTSAAETGRAQESQNAGSAGGKGARGTGGSDDRVEFSGTLNQLSRALTTYEGSRSSRVAALTAAYQGGTYRTDSAATSKGLVAEAMSTGLE
jgi:anti-sigma28 factor (negative regulator of flagellin synthesis)